MLRSHGIVGSMLMVSNWIAAEVFFFNMSSSWFQIHGLQIYISFHLQLETIPDVEAQIKLGLQSTHIRTQSLQCLYSPALRGVPLSP